MITPSHKPLRVFCSYSHRDEEYLNELRTWSRGLERQGLIEWWHDREIAPGWEWEEAIDKNLRIAEIILLLVTPDFMGSDYVFEKEINRAVERHKQGEARVIPIILRPALWKWASFGKLQALPKDAKPITTWANRDQAWLDVVKGIRQTVGEFWLERQKRLASEERYRQAVEEAWTDEMLSDAKAEQLVTLVSELGLSRDTAADIEHRVMGATKQEILERQEQAAREKERSELLEKLYARARELHRDQEWQAVVDVFAEIHAEAPAYPDPEELLQSARKALEIARKKQEKIHRYREAVQWAWADQDLNEREAKRLRDLVNRLELGPNTATDIEREVMGETKEVILGRQEQASAEQYRQAVEEAWTDHNLSNTEAKWLSTLASELGLSMDTAADIEREAIGDTVSAILQRHLDELYTQARQSHQGQEWQKVVDLFERIHAEDPNYPDPEGFLTSARDASKLKQRVAETYDRGLQHMDAEEWPQATRCFEEVQRLEPGYRDIEKLLARVREELAPRTPPNTRGSHSATRWEYTDFDLEIHQQNEPRKYLVAARSSEGEVQEEMHFPFDERELKDKLRDLEVALLRSGGTRRRFSTREEQTVQDFGRALFDALLIGKLRVSYEASLREARRQNKGLRLKLHVQPPELSALPWEFLYDPKRDYLGLSSMTPLVRCLDVPQPTERLAVTLPLRILGMVASPQGFPQLDVGREMRLVEEAIEEVRAQGLVELTWLQGQTWRALQRAMRREEDWHIFHFVGHGGFDPETEEGAIALADEGGRKDLLRGTALARLLDDHYPLRLVFLNSCEGAKGSESEAFSSTAATLVRRGVPAVVAMQYEVTDKAAIEFSRDFYEAVADGLPVDAAVAEARTAVSMSSALEWGMPVLYMRTSDGRIFDVQQTGDRPGGKEPKPGRFKTLPGWEPGSTTSPPPGGKEPKPGRFKTLPGW